jgi:hypothetical protein
VGGKYAAISCLGGGACSGKLARGLHKFMNVITVLYCGPEVDLPAWYQERQYSR